VTSFLAMPWPKAETAAKIVASLSIFFSQSAIDKGSMSPCRLAEFKLIVENYIQKVKL
jgi:hypothetical protein